MKHLTEEDISNLRLALESKKKEIEEQLGRLGSQDPKTGEWKASYKDMGEEWDDSVHEVQNFSDAAALESSLSTHLQEVGAALQRIEQGTYGTCSVGSEEIELDRLMAYPETTLCKKHAKEHAK